MAGIKRHLVKNKCTDFGELDVIKQTGAHNLDSNQQMNAILREKAKKQTAGWAKHQKSEWWKTFPELRMFIKQES